MSQPGEIAAAMKAGYRISIHDRFFPWDAIDRETGEKRTVHAVVDHGAQAIFCSREWFEKLPKESA